MPAVKLDSSEAGFKMRVARCDFMKSEIKYLGRMVSAEGVKPDPKEIAKLRDLDVPRNEKEIQSFLGFANYYPEFILGLLNLLILCTPSLVGERQVRVGV